MLSGFPANSVFIVDSEDRVRHHTVLDPRFNDFYEGLGEVEHDDFVVDDGDVYEVHILYIMTPGQAGTWRRWRDWWLPSGFLGLPLV